MRNC
ncbi:hypothetical protein CIB84_017143 [Bambusicola thoracicus]